MGFAAAQSLAADGASILVVGRDAGRATAAAEELIKLGATAAHGASFDVSAPNGAANAVANCMERFGRLDGLAVTTGMLGHEPISITDERWTEVFRDVLLGVTRTVEAALPHLMERGGTIVTTSAYSIRAPEIARLPYASLKAAVATFTKGIAKTYGAQGVRANCICPGAIETGPSGSKPYATTSPRNEAYASKASWKRSWSKNGISTLRSSAQENLQK